MRGRVFLGFLSLAVLSQILLVSRARSGDDSQAKLTEKQVMGIARTSLGDQAGQQDSDADMDSLIKQAVESGKKMQVREKLGELEDSASDPASLKVIERAYLALNDYDAASRVAASLKSKAGKDPEASFLYARTLQGMGRGPEALAAAKQAYSLAQSQGNDAVRIQAQSFIKLAASGDDGDQAASLAPPARQAGGPSSGRPAPPRASTSGAAAQGGRKAAPADVDPKLTEAARLMSSKSETGADILRNDFNVDPEKVRTLQQALGDKFIVKVDASGKLDDKGVAVEPGTGKDAGRIIMTFDADSLKNNKGSTVAPLVGQALRMGAIARDSEGKPFYSQVISYFDGTMRKIWIAVELKGQKDDQGRIISFDDGTTLSKGINFLLRVWNDQLTKINGGHLSPDETKNYNPSAPNDFKTMKRNEILFGSRGSDSIYTLVDFQHFSDDQQFNHSSDYLAALKSTQLDLRQQDTSFREKLSLPPLQGTK